MKDGKHEGRTWRPLQQLHSLWKALQCYTFYQKQTLEQARSKCFADALCANLPSASCTDTLYTLMDGSTAQFKDLFVLFLLAMSAQYWQEDESWLCGRDVDLMIYFQPFKFDKQWQWQINNKHTTISQLYNCKTNGNILFSLAVQHNHH